MDAKILQANGDKRFDALNGYSNVNEIHYETGGHSEGPYEYLNRNP